MKKEQKLITLLAIITVYVILVPTCILPFFSSYYLYIINPIFWIMMFIITYFFYRDIYIRDKYNKYLAKIVFYVILTFVVIFFLLGFVLGFKTSLMTHTFSAILKNTISLIIVLLIQEYIRYYLINTLKNKTNVRVLITILFIIFDSILEFVLMPKMNFVTFVFGAVLPNIFTNSLCSYLAYKKSLYSSYLVRGMPILIYMLIPVFPKVNYTLFVIFEIIYVFTIYIVVKKNLKSLNKIENKIKVNKNKGIKLTILASFTLLVMFVIGAFEYAPISIFSESMNPSIEVGDAVIYEKIDNSTKLKPNDIIVFVKENKIIVHRIINMKSINGVINITTKGDNNDEIDSWTVYDEDIIGVYKFKIPYIGYPSALIHRILGRE